MYTVAQTLQANNNVEYQHPPGDFFSPPGTQVHVSTSRCSSDRFTYVSSSIPDLSDSLVQQQLVTKGLQHKTQMVTKFWAMDVVKKENNWEVQQKIMRNEGIDKGWDDVLGVNLGDWMFVWVICFCFASCAII